ncbi:MAG: hypothetical protein CMH13_14085 [Martelella sp.]|nr:hypothetical protein [Martelella sp.]
MNTVVNLTLADVQFSIGELGNGLDNWEGTPGHMLLHGLAGCAAAAASGNGCAAGAAGGIASSLAAGYFTRNPVQVDESLSASDQQAQRIAKEQRIAAVWSAVAGYAASGGDGDSVFADASIGQSAIANNRQLHIREIELIEEYSDEFAQFLGLCGGDTPCSADDLAEAERRLAQQAYRQVQAGYDVITNGQWDSQAQTFLSELGQQVGMIDGVMAFRASHDSGGLLGFGAIDGDWDNTELLLDELQSNPAALGFYKENGLVVPPSSIVGLSVDIWDRTREQEAYNTAVQLAVIATASIGAAAAGVAVEGILASCAEPVHCIAMLGTFAADAVGSEFAGTSLVPVVVGGSVMYKNAAGEIVAKLDDAGRMVTVNAGNSGPRFITRADGQTLDTGSIKIPGPTNSPYGKMDYLLGKVPGNQDSIGKGGYFEGALGFKSSDELASAMESHLKDNFSDAVITGNKVEVTAPITGPNGVTANVKAAWQVKADGSVSFVTAFPGPRQ